METLAVVLSAPGQIDLQRLVLDKPTAADIVVDIEYSGISTGTERLLWQGRMPNFPGMGYPLVPGYEAVGRVVEAGAESGFREGDYVFVPGARCYGAVRGLFGGATARLISSGARAIRIDENLRAKGVLLALAATAHHALEGGALPDLIVGHGVLGRLLARVAVALGGRPKVWEKQPLRRDGAEGYQVVDPAEDERKDYGVILDASGDAALLDRLIGRLGHGGEVVLAGFYEAPLSFAFPPAFMREARIRIAAEWKPADLSAVQVLVSDDRLSLDGLITHASDAAAAPAAYATAFSDAACLKMILDWRGRA
jgi:3-hydroxyethyl bacteriochlorophyllide a dehydrogenase